MQTSTFGYRCRAFLGSLVLLGAWLVSASQADAQTIYVASEPQPGIAPDYGNWTPITFRHGSNVNNDEGIATLTIPFDFEFFEQTYTELDATANGLLLFGQTTKTCTGGVVTACNSPRTFPYSALPNNLLAFWWDDMDITGGQGEYAVSGTAPNRVMAIRYRNWGKRRFNLEPAARRTVQVELHESNGLIRIYYGDIDRSGSNVDNATVGAENADGTQGVVALDCSVGPVMFCKQDDWPANSVVEIAPAIAPELIPVELTGSGLRPVTVNGNPGYQLDVTATIENRGRTAATGFTWNVYLSLDDQFDREEDQLLLTHATPETLAGNSRASWTDTNVEFERPSGTGNFYLFLEVDPPTEQSPHGAVLEAIETNNVVRGPTYVSGAELSGSIQAPSAAGPNEVTDVRIRIANSGADPTGPFKYELWMSEDNRLGTGDTRFHTGTLNLAGGEVFDEDVEVQFPIINVGNYYVLLVIDSDDDVTEQNENDNLAVSQRLTFAAADIVVENVRLRSATPPHQRITTAFFGERVQITFGLRNQGGAAARNFNVGLFLSDEAVITLHDQLLHSDDPQINGVTLQSGESVEVAVEIELPTTDEAGRTFVDAEFYFGVIADVGGRVTESNEVNNIQRDPDPILLRQPAPDFLPIRVDVPAAAAAGEVMPVHTVIRNIGNRGNESGPAIEYRYVLTANELVTEQDLPMAVMIDGVAHSGAELRLAAGEEHRQSDLLLLPMDITPGTYYVGLIVDATGAIAELDETNNVALSLGAVEIVPSSLRVESGYLPDALVGVPYLQQLVASGGDGTYVWSLEPETGALPAGLTLSEDGTISGTATGADMVPPAQSNVSVFTVRVESGGRAARARLVIRAVQPTGGLEIVSRQLPRAIRGVDYATRLVAVGGVAPYSWTLFGGDLPAGILLSPEGELSGKPTKSYQEPLPLQLRVTDALGVSVEAELSMTIAEPGTMMIVTHQLPDAVVSQPYATQLLTLGGTAPFTWSLASGALPDGLQLSGGAITGSPRKPGMFPIALQVTDAEGATDRHELVLTVLPRGAKFMSPRIPLAVAGEPYSLDLLELVDPNAVLAIYSGALPTGLELQGKVISGTVAEDAREGAWDFILEISEESGARTLAPLTIVVAGKPAADTGAGATGCSTAGTGELSFVAALLVMLPMLRRIRRRVRLGDEP